LPRDGLLQEVCQTHPWITFELPEMPQAIWFDLGRVTEALRFLAGMPVLPEERLRLHQVYLAKGALATTAIEGNTLSEEQALQQVQGTLHLAPSKTYLGQEIQNVVDACNYIGAGLLEGELSGRVRPELIRRFNEMVLAGDIPRASEAVPGQFREYDVGVGNVYRAVPHRLVRPLTERLCGWLHEGFGAGREEWTLGTEVLKAIVAHIYLAWIHPFGDGNGRTARLLEFYILLAAGAPTFTAHLLSNHYNETRARYYEELDKASGSGGDIRPFVAYAVQGLVDGLEGQIAELQAQQMKLVFKDFVRSALHEDRGPTGQRREMLALALAEEAKPVPRSRIPLLTPEIAAEYGPKGKTSKTVTRDLNALITRGLAVRAKEGYIARTDEVRAYLPDRVQRATGPQGRPSRRTSH